MTSQKDQIQTLITEIDGVLQKTTPRLPWVVSGEITQQRQVLERVRNYLVAFQRRQIAGEGFGQAGARPDLLAHDIYYQPAQPPYPSPSAEAQPGQAYGQDEVNAQQMLQALVQEMGYLRSNLMQPLQTDLEVLRQQRETLVHEIRQLEAQRQSYAGQLPGQQQLITEFLQALMSRLQETLPQQLAQTLRSPNQQALLYAGPNANDLALAGSAPSVIATSNAPSQGLSHIQVPQGSSDELLMRLDSTLSVVFESLQRNVQAYQESLSQGLDKMHSMGQQGEMMFTALISHLAQQLGRETSPYLQPPASTGQEFMRSSPSFGATTSTPAPTQPLRPTVNPSLLSQPGADAVSSPPLALPFPGTEISDYAGTTSTASTNVPVPSVDTAIDSWLRASSASVPPDVDLEIAALNLEGFDLSQLEAQDVNALLELDATLLGTNLPSQPLLAPTAPITDRSVADAAMSNVPTVEDTADIDAALKLLEQLSAELQQPSSVAEADAQIDRMLSSPALAEDAATVGIPDDARDELDEFYESLFGNDAVNTDAIVASTQKAPAQVAPSATELAPQPAVAPVVRTEPAVAPSDIQPSDIQPDVQPISTLPAETQAPADALVEPTAPAAPSASTVADPTLGWHLPTVPLVTQPAAEPEIPIALLEDELLDGWDLADAEMGVSPSAAIPAADALLGDWDLAPDDRTSLPLDAPSLPATDMPATDELTTFFGENQPSETEASPTLALPLDAATASDQNETSQYETSQYETSQYETSQDEIISLDDLFSETTLFGATAPSEGQPLESTIADAPAPPAMPDQPPVNPPASQTGWSFPDVSPAQTPPANLVEGYLADDRYTPASPDEDLLSLDEPAEALDSELWLDENTLNRLSEDLFNLEEAIGEPSTLPYASQPDASTPAQAGATAPSEPAPIDSEATLGDWSDVSLGDFAADLDNLASNEIAAPGAARDKVAATPPTTDPTLFPLESESSAIAADPPGTFILEGMDDLFADTPVAPPVTPIAPPVPPATEPPAAFTLEGMDDLFGDALVSDRSLQSALTPAAEPPFTLEGVDELFADAPIVNTAPLPSVSPPPADQPLPFTLEGVDELFADMPPVAATPPVSAAPQAILPVAEGLSAEPIMAPFTASTQSDPVSAFTLEEMGDLFVERSATEASAHDVVSPPAIASAPTPLPAEGPILTAPFTLEQMGDLFMEVPSGESTLNERSTATPTAPLELSSALSPDPFTLESFTLEQVGDLFVETPSAAAPLADPPNAPLPTPQPPAATSEPSALEQAFASLMGAFDEPLEALPSLTDTTETTTQAPEKKKEMS